MGISGLLPLLKSVQKPCNLKKYAGQTIGVDTYGWLHRGTAACAIDLALDKPTTKYVDFVMNRVHMLIHFGITPYLVFDGDNLPSKAGTEKDRRERRKEGKRLGLELLKVGKAAQAQQELQKSVDVTPEMARMVIEELKHHNIQYVVAPYEADSQLAYLERKGIINGVLSEDSDLLVFGVKCLITKLDKYGDCIEVNRNHFTACREVSFVGWSDADFRRMCILSGCDYLPGIGGLGLKTAHRMLRKHKTVDRLVKAVQFDGKLKVPAGFMADFDQAEKTFLYQWVYCPIDKKLVNLTPVNDGISLADMPYLGEEVPSDLATGVARGDLYPRTKLPMNVDSNTKPSGQPLVPSRRASAVVQTPDAKGSKPIDSFFKPKRTPLAELSPNCFTPSPSQQVLLEQQRRTSGWAAVPAPISRLQQQYPPPPSTAPQPRRTSSDPTAGRRSVPHPSKRQRLCTDSVSDAPAAGGEGVVRSQFFTSNTPEPSPSLNRTKMNRRKTDQDFELYSDDSMQEAIAAVADLEEFASKSKKKLRIFSDTQAVMRCESQSTVTSRGSTAQSQDTLGTLTPASSHGSPEPETVFSAAISSQMSELRSKFIYKAAVVPSPTPCMPRAAKARLERRYTEIRQPVPPPIEPTLASLATVADSVVRGTPPPVDDEEEIADSAWANMEAEVVVAASSPPHMTPAKRRRSSLKGSEDFLVPDSDAESECSPRKPMFNLARFAFPG
ncbi:Exo 5'-3' exonuclease including N-terminal domain of PolI [Pyrenophora tritici-repentis]|uniref:Exo, 5'-3' exonuclease (Including N-terminal domain PolI) n=2 Tax=Pyrenophora tritici-repentis TaxID=45151 RepID=A0A2W1DF63_9PLEO|nr:exodeoxyribonuclease 1 [Pyrenophora tritici-repentis Pt-1C-BFP]KAA8613524.1 Exo 5-3 exonuclease [Pyrenophora tritici-repentis]EDU49371.1 exodeoxyribonuclease 1 [Pyrenophora tritici-repentis Pt-1C-BFP]KAF7445236.1 Exo 5'-3' exonuclease [Pyrenophora tritici-repentis]KAF7565501.1 Exo, 5'-3' exonuclease (including N-terminal domain PolI) [Pyrenophora tritici-repentis]KAG9380366.1 Exo 5'-3' exonuclease [Pyrenophora tritici-repentis]